MTRIFSIILVLSIVSFNIMAADKVTPATKDSGSFVARAAQEKLEPTRGGEGKCKECAQHKAAEARIEGKDVENEASDAGSIAAAKGGRS